MSKAAPPSVLPTATVFALTVTFSKLIGWSPELAVFVHSLVPALRSIAAIWLQPCEGLSLVGMAGSYRIAVLPSVVVCFVAWQTGPGSLIVHCLAPVSRL